MPPVLLVPAFKYLIIVGTPWLAGSAVVGFLHGRKEAELAASRLRLARQHVQHQELPRQQAPLERSQPRELNLSEPIHSVSVSSIPAAKRHDHDLNRGRFLRDKHVVAAMDPKKASLLKQFLLVNVKLREDYFNDRGDSANA